METSVLRLKKYIDYKGINVANFEKSIGMSNASFGKSLKNGGAIGSDKLENILSIYGEINPEWLLTGKGDMLKSKSGKAVATKTAIGGVPLIPIEAFAGWGGGNVSVMDYEVEEHYVLPNIKHIDFLIKVTGDSMLPKYNGGDLVACIKITELTFIQWNKIYVLDTTQGVIIKRLHEGKDEKHLICISENPKYTSFIISKKDIRAIALVVGGVVIE